jgi:hypothetical protein
MSLQNMQLSGVCCVSQGVIHRQGDFVLSKPLSLYRIMTSNWRILHTETCGYLNLWLRRHLMNVSIDALPEPFILRNSAEVRRNTSQPIITWHAGNVITDFKMMCKQLSNVWFQASDTVCMRPSPFWDTTQRILVAKYRRFGRTYWVSFSRVKQGQLDGTDVLSRNDGNQIRIYDAITSKKSEDLKMV